MCGAFDEGLDYSLGVNYKYGFNGFPVDLKKAHTYLKAAAKNNAYAAAMMAFFYLDEDIGDDKFIEDNPIEYIRWLKKAADMGNDTVIKLMPSFEKKYSRAIIEGVFKKPTDAKLPGRWEEKGGMGYFVFNPDGTFQSNMIPHKGIYYTEKKTLVLIIYQTRKELKADEFNLGEVIWGYDIVGDSLAIFIDDRWFVYKRR